MQGLPQNSYRLTAASGLLEAKNGDLVSGFRGFVLTELELERSAPGGECTSTDRGVTWLPAAMPLQFDPYV